ncbi:hypothetical protein JVT61DRAFT_13359 [Boletus reticuloceps]|uniref:Uncharacterized protein n=1 Tax=Boletus reticuloceps TaxID=495285 RepID=A0A8I2YDL5_9AGAM|nr:hypothetical protein JVT61DRAFT_13359 [Boletus reticuloceps]
MDSHVDIEILYKHPHRNQLEPVHQQSQKILQLLALCLLEMLMVMPPGLKRKGRTMNSMP